MFVIASFGIPVHVEALGIAVVDLVTTPKVLKTPQFNDDCDPPP